MRSRSVNFGGKCEQYEIKKNYPFIALEQNRCCHHPSPLRDDKMLSLNRETPISSRIHFRILGSMSSGSGWVFAGMGIWSSGVSWWALLLLGLCMCLRVVEFSREREWILDWCNLSQISLLLPLDYQGP